MSQPKPPVGSIGWIDLTVPNADEVRDFYAQVTGWQPEALDMGGYSDYVMKTPDGEGKAGVCHARGDLTAADDRHRRRPSGVTARARP